MLLHFRIYGTRHYRTIILKKRTNPTMLICAKTCQQLDQKYAKGVSCENTARNQNTISIYLSPTELVVELSILLKAYSARLGLSLLAELVGLFGLPFRPRESSSPSPCSADGSLKCQKDSALSRIGLAGGEGEEIESIVCAYCGENERRSGGGGARLQAEDLVGSSGCSSPDLIASA